MSGSTKSALSKVLFENVPKEDLEALSAETRKEGLAQAAATADKFGGKAAIVSFSDGWLTIAAKDSPFIVDSVLGSLSQSGTLPELVAHPRIEHDGHKISVMALALPGLSAKRSKSVVSEIKQTLKDVGAVVGGWQSMQKRVETATDQLESDKVKGISGKVMEESIAFLRWLLDGQFIFMGVRRYDWNGTKQKGQLAPSKSEKGLGLLADPDLRVLRQGSTLVTMSPDIRAFLHGKQPLIITKAGIRSRVHRQSHYDYIGVKQYDEKGELAGELRIIGLFTSGAYSQSVRRIPLLRQKVDHVIAKSKKDELSHSGKALINVLETYPRDELFQIEKDTLNEFANGIVQLDERPRSRAFVRVDKFNRFISCLVYVPRDRYDSNVRQTLGSHLAELFDGRVSMFQPAFPEGRLARVHFIIGRDSETAPKVDHDKLNSDIARLVRNWDDAFEDILDEQSDASELKAPTFSASYKNAHSPETALDDAKAICKISEEEPLKVRFTSESSPNVAMRLAHFGPALQLSRRVPMLENFGFDVLEENTFEVNDANVHLHEMTLRPRGNAAFDEVEDAERLRHGFMEVWEARADSDGYNALVLTAGLTIEQVTVLRAYSRYFQQILVGFTQDYMWTALRAHPDITKLVWQFFEARFDPSLEKDRQKAQDRIAKKIEAELETVSSIDEDAIIRRFLETMQATLRTNYYQSRNDGEKRELALKIDPHKVANLPEPRPYREIWIFGGLVEGVHLRFGPVARGGLRWSDRAQDFRTEVLGLVKAQQVKNAVIVPVGSKGGFYPKQLPDPSQDRDAWFEAGRDAYKVFIRSLLSVTDNIVNDKTVHPENTVIHDGEDPYFVVAADKGTATFSDTANGIAQSEEYWLDDAFASGGSAGYDHKKMGITARGGWEAVKRHFREINHDIQTQPFTAVGVGDMSGDVFGNGMLLSEQTKLLAAFDHRDIFLDPDPNPDTSFKERKRLFEMGRSSWQDYNQSFLSKGGMIVSRQNKKVDLTKEVQEMLGINRKQAAPNEILKAILTSPSDLLWFGGIGTYVKAESENNAEVGDRANDAIRINGSEVGAKVIGEGANLGVTQPGRIEFAQAGGRVNSDAIDNSAGVNSSDVEVNIKIALSGPMRSDDLPRPKRNKLLERMTDEVADLVLRNNYLQALAITMEQERGVAMLPAQQRFMQAFEREGDLDREVEDLPDDRALARRMERDLALTRPEIGVLLAYAKIVLFQQLVDSDLPDDPYFETALITYFPKDMQKNWVDAIKGHRLRREIIATVIANDIVNRTGPTFVQEASTRTGESPVEVTRAYMVVRDGNELPGLLEEIDGLDNKVEWELQHALYRKVSELIQRQTIDSLRRGTIGSSIGDVVSAYRSDRTELLKLIPKSLPAYIKDRHAAKRETYGEPEAVSAKLAKSVADLILAAHVPDIRTISDASGTSLSEATEIYFRVTEAFRIGMIADAAEELAPEDFFEGLAHDRALYSLRRARIKISQSVVAQFGKEDDPVANWMASEREAIGRIRSAISGVVDDGALSDLTVTRLSVVANFLEDLSAGDGANS
jgi:glutamate dehydrogenase